MAKTIYTGVDGAARKVTKIYIGVDGVARKVKKAFIGVGSVARQVYSAFEFPTFTGSFAISGDETKGVMYLKSSGTLTIKSDADYDFFLVGGGAVGGSKKLYGTGGGGAGYTNSILQVNCKPQACNVVIGAGGVGGGTYNGNDGGCSSLNINNTVFSVLGGHGGYQYTGGNGGSGGGGGGQYDSGNGVFGGYGGSDGGDGGLGGDSPSGIGTGQGRTTRAFGEVSNTLYAGGGGGGMDRYYFESRGIGGAGGGGDTNCNGVANTGGGAGGGAGYAQYQGGSGLVIIRWGY